MEKQQITPIRLMALIQDMTAEDISALIEIWANQKPKERKMFLFAKDNNDENVHAIMNGTYKGMVLSFLSLMELHEFVRDVLLDSVKYYQQKKEEENAKNN